MSWVILPDARVREGSGGKSFSAAWGWFSVAKLCARFYYKYEKEVFFPKKKLKTFCS